jgi:hypothetical protein
MKLKVLLLSLVLFSFTLSDQDSKTDLLCDKKWELQFVELNELKVPTNGNKDLELWMLFEKNGILKTKTTKGVVEGSWKFTMKKDSIFITNERDDEKKFALKKLNKESLVLIITETGETGTLHFGLLKK